LIRQVRYLGVFQTIEIKKKVFPSRRTYEEMKLVFGPVFKETKGKTDREAVNAMFRSVDAVPSLYLLGIRRVYMSI
jgi:myosin heavy subunit